MLEGTHVILDRFCEKIAGLMPIAASLDNQEMAAGLEKQLQKVRNVEFHIMILGLFKRGKSTLINYFLSAKLLPTGVVPVTSVASYIRFGEIPQVKVIFKDTSEIMISTEQIDAYASERGNPGNEKNVDRIEIYYPSAFLKNGVVLVDTPGTGSTNIENTKEAYRFLPEADAALFLLSSDAPISELELNYLSEVRNYYEKVYILQNKTDHLAHDEREEVVAFTERIIKQAFGEKMQVFPVSAKLAMEGRLEGDDIKIRDSGMALFEEELEGFLVEERAFYMLSSNKRKILSMIKTLEENICFQIDMLQAPIGIVQSKVKQFEEKIVQIGSLKKECMAILGVDLDEVMEEFLIDIGLFKKETGESIKRDLTEYFNEHKHSAKHSELKESLEKRLQDGIRKAFSTWNSIQEEKMKTAFKRVADRFASQLNNAQEHINDITQEVFGFRLLENVDTVDIQDNKLFYFRFSAGNASLLVPDMKSLKFLLNKEKKAEFMLENVLGQVGVELQKNADGLRWSYVQKFKDSKRMFESMYQEKADAVVSTVRKMIAQAVEKRNEEEGRVEKRVEYLRETRERLIREKHSVESMDLSDTKQKETVS
ncbi:MAG: dynamin family protein [Bacillota bacterium]